VSRSSSITSHLTLGRSVVLGLVELVGDGTGGTRDAVGDGVVAGDVALGLLLVGLLGGLSGLWMDVLAVWLAWVVHTERENIRSPGRSRRRSWRRS